MGDANPIRTLGDYSKHSHEGSRNTIELPLGNNAVPLRSDTIRCWNDLRDFAKLVKEICLPQDVLSTSDRRLIKLKNQVQRLLEARLALMQPTQVNKITSSCEICSGPHDTQYCMENPEQAFVEYASLYQRSRSNNPQNFNNRSNLEGLVSNFMASQDARLSKFEVDFKQQQSEMTNKIDIVLRAITDRMAGALPSDMVKNSKLNTSPVFLELGKNGSTFIQGEVSAKMEDPELFTLPCRLGDSKLFDTLADLGLCVNLISLYLFKKLNIELLEETDHIFGLADGTKSYPIGIVKDVEVIFDDKKLEVLRSFISMFELWFDVRIKVSQVIDFLNRSHICYALTKKPDVYISFIKQFWRSAEATNNDNGKVQITATIDGHSKTITKASLRRHLKLDDRDGITSIPNSKIFEQLALMGYHTDSDKLTFQKVLEDDLKKTKLTYSAAVTKLILRVKKLETQVKAGTARKRARVVLSEDDEDVEDDSSKQGRKLSDAERFKSKIQGSSEKGNSEVSTAGATKGTASEVPVVSTAEVNISTAGRTVTYRRRSEEKRTRKDKGKEIMTKQSLLQEQVDEEERAQVARDEEIARQLLALNEERVTTDPKTTKDINWNDPSVQKYWDLKNKPKTVSQARRNMVKYLKNQGNYKISDFKGMSYNEIRPIFEKVWDFNQHIKPMDLEHGSERMKSPEKIKEEDVDTQKEMIVNSFACP
ncbi:MAK10-like protein [Tanacetum coccineum]|uniref:MAK10-like protein n=1 Tax=Tanacetum coccineum TaxID=301880 RepID=A0ABQ5J1Z6_9ASTR